MRLIVGEALQRCSAPQPARWGRAGAARPRSRAAEPSSDLSLDMRAGEWSASPASWGQGGSTCAALLFGALAREAGAVGVAGVALSPSDPRAAIAAGVAYVPADRHADGAVMTMRVRENVTLPNLRRLRRRLGWLDAPAERRDVDRWVDRVGLQPADPERPLELFSGGNQQKVVLAKWLRNEPRLLLLDEPTQGVDVGAKAAIYELVHDAAAGGAAVLMASSDTGELASVCDRVLVMSDGIAAAEITGPDLTEERLVIEGLGRRVPATAATTTETTTHE